MTVKHELFTYTDEQWAQIREQVLAELGVDVDQIERQVTFHHVGSDFEENFTGMEPLRDRIEYAANEYRFHSVVNRQQPRRAELDTLRMDAENLRTSIIDAFSVPLGDHRLSFNEDDADMLTATKDYFGKLASNLDRQIKQARSRDDNARKTERNELWSQLLADWIDIGGKPTGEATERFLIAASAPVGAGAGIEAVRIWLKRRRKIEITKPVLRRRATR